MDDVVSIDTAVAVAAVALVAALLVGLLPRLPVPQVVLLLVGGILIGPDVLAVETPGDVRVLADVGLGFVFLLAGYEIDLRLFREDAGRRAMLSWAVSFGLAAGAVGILAAASLVEAFLPIVLGLTTTALGTLLPVLREAGLLRGRLGRYLLAAGGVGGLLPVLVIAVFLGSQGRVAAVDALGGVAALALAGRLGTFWYFRSRTIEGRAWTERALDHEHLADPLSAALVRLTLAHLLSAGGLDDLADQQLGTAFGLLDGSGHTPPRIVAETQTLLTHSLVIAGGIDRAREVTERVRAAAAAGTDPELRLLAETCAAHVDSRDGLTTDQGLSALHRRALDLGNVHVALLAAGLAVVGAIREGDPARGLAWSDRMIAHRRTLGNTDGPVAFELRALIAAMRGRPREAVRLFSASRT